MLSKSCGYSEIFSKQTEPSRKKKDGRQHINRVRSPIEGFTALYYALNCCDSENTINAFNANLLKGALHHL